MDPDADEALRLAEADPGRSVPLAHAALRRAEAAGDPATASVARRALGLAALHLQDPDAAMRHLRAAVTLGRRAGSPRLAAEARMRLAFIMNVRGRPRQALREIDAVLADLDGVEQAQANAQRGAILHQLGRLDEALAGYHAALPALRRADDLVWVKKVLSNRGVLHGQRHEFGAAEADLREAEQLNRDLGLGLTLAFVQQNLGWINGLRGEVPRALEYLDAAEQSLRSLRSQLGWVLQDRAGLLLSVGLVSEARDAAEQAVHAFEREHRRIALPAVRLLLARTALLEGEPEQALAQARRAAREFGSERPGWAAVARYVALACQAAGPRRHLLRVGRLVQAADALTNAGWPAEALDARILAAQLALERGDVVRAREQLRLAGGTRRRGPAAMRARGWHAEALLRQSAGDRPGAVRAVRAALRILDDHRSSLGATDLRAQATTHRIELNDLGLRMAFDQGRPDRVLEWAERGRAGHLLLRPVHAPHDPALAQSLAELRAAAVSIGQSRAEGRPTAALEQRQVVMERRIRDYSRRRAGDPAGQAVGQVPWQNLAQALGERALVEFVRLDGTLYAVTVVSGRGRVRALGPIDPVRHLIDRIPFALRRLAADPVSTASRDAALALLRHAARELDRILLAPLAGDLADRPLVLIPTAPLQPATWSILPSCAGRPITVSPSAALWYAGRGPNPAGHTVVVAGPRLPGGYDEAVSVAAIHGTSALLHGAATVPAVLAALDGAGVAHLATHGHVHRDSPLFSSLLLADGPLTVYDLERLHRAPQLVVLAACDIGRSVVRAGDELLGLTASFLSLGARQVVASTVPVRDAETAPLMSAFHRLLAGGLPAATALAAAQEKVAEEDPAVLAAAAGFVCMGAEFSL